MLKTTQQPKELTELQAMAAVERWTPERLCTELYILDHPVSFATASNWLRGKNTPRAASLVAIRRLLEKHGATATASAK